MKILNILGIIVLFALLTVLSQVGGVILLLWILLFYFLKRKLTNPWIRRGANIVGFVIFYLFFTFAVIPPLARIQDRVPLPLSKSGALVPVSYWTVIFNRNYIKSKGRDKLEKIAASFVKKYPELKVKYMDCNYPFRFNVKGDVNIWVLEGLLPHLTHDGAKADIALVYNDASENPSNLTPTFFAYGSSVDPLPNETCTPCRCDKKSSLYSFMYRNIPKSDYALNNLLSRELIMEFQRDTKDPIFIEKHLVQRFKLKGNFLEAGCHSVRHDDHFHVTLCANK